ncbi:hypothetical protein QL285_082880 [Trifolium repens]|nr:hypothetical protein QL285_082880 [Trifolium repens]
MKTRYLMLSAVWHHLGVSVDSQYLCSHGIDRDLVTSSSASPFSYANSNSTCGWKTGDTEIYSKHERDVGFGLENRKRIA